MSKREYKVGDKVKVRSDLVVGKMYGCESFVDKMSGFRGKICTIEKSWETEFHLKEVKGGWYFTSEMLEPVSNSKIVITTDGRETKARLYEGEELKKTATTVCHPDDEFDFNIGAEVAFSRLVGRKTEKASEEFKPYLEYENYSRYEKFGIIGTPTKFKDAVGKQLFVGDVVEIFLDGVGMELCFVAENCCSEQFIHLIKGCCNGGTGEITEYKVLRHTPYTEIIHNETHNGVTAKMK